MPTTIAQDWASFDDAHRQQLLARMTPEQKNQLRQELEGPPGAPTETIGPDTGPHGFEGWRDALTRIQPINPRDTVAQKAATLVGDIGAGGLGVLLHPIDTVTGLVKSVVPGTDTPNPLRSTYEGLNTQPAETIASGIGQAAAMGGVGKVAGRIIPPAFRSGTDMIAGTGPKVAAKLAKSTAAENAAAAEKYYAATATANDIAAKRTAHQATINEGTRELQGRIETARNNALKEGNEKYNGVNEALSDIPADMEVVESGLGDAAEKIRGTQKLPTVLKTLQEKIGRGEPLDYNDLQGFYSEMNNELSKGTLPGDEYAAIDAMHDVIGNEMQRIADSKGMGQQLIDARNYWRRMKQTFGKPVVGNDVATKTLRTISPEAMRAEELANRLRLLSNYDPEIGRVAGDVTAARAALKSLPPPKPAPVQANLQSITPEQVVQAKADALQNRAGWINHRGMWAAAAPFIYSLKDILHGNLGVIPGDVGYGSALAGGTMMFSKVLEHPAVVNFLSKATPRDLAAIPPELRSGNWQPIIDAAKAKGIPISPYVAGLAATPRPQHPTLSAASPVQ